MKRTIEIKFPDVSWIHTRFECKFLKKKNCNFFCVFFQEIDGGNEFLIVRGIKHSSRLDDDECQPEAMLTDGGINEHTATLEIISQRGCGLDSLVEFFIEQL